MNVYSNSNQVTELIASQTNIEVEPFDNHVPEDKHVDVFLFDDNLLQLEQDLYKEDKAWIHAATLLWRRPDYGGIILEMVKYNEYVYCLTAVGTVFITTLKLTISSSNHVTRPTWWPDIALSCPILSCYPVNRNRPSKPYCNL